MGTLAPIGPVIAEIINPRGLTHLDVQGVPAAIAGEETGFSAARPEFSYGEPTTKQHRTKPN